VRGASRCARRERRIAVVRVMRGGRKSSGRCDDLFGLRADDFHPPRRFNI
jgi:hypothetical protein